MEQQHAIGKLMLEVQLPSREEAFALQGTLSTRCTTELEPMLAALLDSWTDPDTLLQIDKLEIDLGSCDIETLRRELPEMVITYLRKHYQGMQAELVLDAGMQRMPLRQGYYESWLYFLEHGHLPSSAVKWQQEEWEAGILTALSSETYALQQCKVLFTEYPYAVKRLVLQFSPAFVQNWILAYSADAYRHALQLLSEWETFIYQPQLREVITATMPAQQQQLMPALPAKGSYHDDSLIWLIREMIVPGRSIGNVELLQQLMQRMGSASPKDTLPRFLYLLQKANTTAVKAAVLLQQTGAALSTQYLPEITALQRSLFTGRSSAESNKEETTTQQQQDDAVKDAVKEQQRASERAAHEQERRDEIARREQSEADVRSDKASSAEKKESTKGAEQRRREQQDNGDDTDTAQQRLNKTAITSEGKQDTSSVRDEEPAAPELPAEGSVYYINNSGLIILHPYLSHFFDALQLREGREFKDEESKHRAVQLLGYLAHGEEEIPEYDLVLPKILCGIQPAEPVKRFIPLTDVEKAEANELLTTVISHWNALGNTSADGLRGNFLLREGKLEWKEDEWQLYVTQQAYDMLLNRLPWGFSVVGLSWMPWLIKTVWT